MHKISQWIQRHSLFLCILSIVLSGCGAYFSAKLYQNLRTDIEELLPETARSVVDLKKVTERLESIDSINVILFSEDAKNSKKFVQDLAKKLSAYPKSDIAWVEYKIQNEISFFRRRQALFLDLQDLEKIKNYIESKISYETQLFNPLNIFQKEELKEPKLDFDLLLKKYKKKASGFDHYPDGYYATPDEKVRVVQVYLPGKVSDQKGAEKLQSIILNTVEELQPKTYAADLEIRLSGGVQDLIEERNSLIEDLTSSALLVIVLILAVLILYFGSWVYVGALMISLFSGTLWALGASYFIIGYLNANSAFLGSIILGNGVNYGVIILARFLEEKRNGKTPSVALDLSLSQTWKPTLVASLAAGVSFGSLAFTSFRGFQQFGVIGFLGMAFCWISAVFFLPALIHQLEKLRFMKKKRMKKPHPLFSSWIQPMIQKGSKWILAFALLLTACFGYFWTKLDHSLLETDLKNLRSQKSLEEGSAYYSKYTDQIFQRYGTPLVFLPENIQEGREIKQRLEEQKQKEGESSLIDQITFMDDFIPKNQIEKIQVLRKIRDLISPRIFAQLKPIEQELIQNFLTPESFFPISTHDLPELIRQKLREKDGTEGRLVLVEPPIGESSRDATRLQEWVKTLRSIGDKVKPGTPLAGQLAVSSDLIQSIQKDGPKATFYSLIAVSLLVLLLFLRSPRVILVTLSTVVFGVLWLFGVMVSLDWKINFLNFIALPMMFGIGVDYAINVFDRYRAEKEKGILHALEHTGGAIFVASLTTMIGFGSLLMATNMAFFSFGRLAVTGCLTSFILAILVIPTVLYQLELSRHNRS